MDPMTMLMLSNMQVPGGPAAPAPMDPAANQQMGLGQALAAGMVNPEPQRAPQAPFMQAPMAQNPEFVNQTMQALMGVGSPGQVRSLGQLIGGV